MPSIENRETLSSEEALQRIRRGSSEPFRVNDLLDVRSFDGNELPTGISCFDLDATGTSLLNLPDDIEIDNRLILDQCTQLEALPEGLTVGSLWARGATSLHALPEGLDTWFLDLSECSRFHQWPQEATVHRGRVALRNCLDLQLLPPWFENLMSLDLAGCFNLRAIPDGFTVSQWIDVGGTRIKSLPPTLTENNVRWRGVQVPHQIAFKPESITAGAVTNEDNAEVRRVMIERMGYQRFAAEAGAHVLDNDTDPGGKRQLLRIDLNDDEPLVGLSCFCPSTGQQYLLRVPPDTITCHQAAAWLAGFDDPDLYKPVVET